MRGFTVFGTFMIGAVLMAGEWFFPNQLVMWFASNSEIIHDIRPVVLILLAIMALLQGIHDSVYMRFIWGLATVSLLWGGLNYFLDHPEYVFDVMFMLSSSICFALATLCPADDRLAMPKFFGVLLPGAAITYYSRLHAPRLSAAPTWHAHDVHNPSHRLVLQSGP